MIVKGVSDMDDNEMLQRACKQWDRYSCADWEGKLCLMRHSFSVKIVHTNEFAEFVSYALDGKKIQEFRLPRPGGDESGSFVRDFVRFVFSLGPGETKLFRLIKGKSEFTWLLSREGWTLYVDAPGISDGFFIRYGVFRDAWFAEYERVYGFGYRACIQRIEVPAEDLESLRALETEDEFELVRFIDDQSFETTDVQRLFKLIEKRRSDEETSFSPDKDHINSLDELRRAIEYYLAEHKRLRRAKKLLRTIGMDFSRLKNNWEECDFCYNVSLNTDDWHYDVYRRYGDLPDGRHFGVYIWPKHEECPPTSIMMIVGENGKMQTNSVMDDRWEADEADRWPLAAVASPSGKSIVWLKDGRIWVWREDWRRDKQDIRFQPDDGEDITQRLENCGVRDAIMLGDGILVMFLEDGRRMGYLCDADLVLFPWNDGWIPRTEEHLQLSML